MMTTTLATAGLTSVTLAGTRHELALTLRAATRISRSFGGFQAAQQKLLDGDFDAFVTVLQHGLGLKTEEEVKAMGLRDKLFRTGVNALVLPLVEYVLTLANGGRPLEEAAAGEPATGTATEEED
jgi:hypothetical protein